MSDTLRRDQAADHAMRNWVHEHRGPVQVGSDAHKQMFCRMLLDTHNPYKPAVIDWPLLEPEALRRLTSLPIWDIAVQTEGRASIRVATFASTVRDPLLREALDMDAAEEARHKVVLSKLVGAYGIRLAPEPAYPAPSNAEWAWMVTGFSECIDSFFAFGLFRSAQRSGYFPEELVETFEPVIQEEGRHILFFVNWFAWYWRNLPWWRRPWFFMRVAAVWAFLIWERIGIARGIDTDGVARDANFPANTAATVGDALNPRDLIELCLSENDRRMAGYDKRLLRPAIVPRLARFALRFLRK
ncbi:aminomethyltransferase [Burkholderia mayonis]|uniref:Aminomethyltransferase n=1 Tax=Burkholderia mayonis TaxID=1385591 RepID=A0A1B4FSH2_9BURK|nr:aminomethyltransferase [Burkholderia mayonis]AOJ06632.1 aminomethyltransferase [Burkholderia mayonis]KVE57332.1 aminomethyltransferase [Burkholderia mayonis]